MTEIEELALRKLMLGSKERPQKLFGHTKSRLLLQSIKIVEYQMLKHLGTMTTSTAVLAAATKLPTNGCVEICIGSTAMSGFRVTLSLTMADLLDIRQPYRIRSSDHRLNPLPCLTAR